MGRCPEDLDSLIRLANAALAGIGRISPKTWDDIDLNFVPRPENPQEEQTMRLEAKNLKGTILYSRSSPALTLLQYRFAEQVRGVLIKVAQFASIREREWDVPVDLPPVRNVALIKPNGRVVVEPKHAFESHMYGRLHSVLRDVDCTRIHVCACQRLYWAGRTGKRYCSPRCRGREWREKEPVKAAAIQARYDGKRATRRQGQRDGNEVALSMGSRLAG
jgi:hypothetical protein